MPTGSVPSIKGVALQLAVEAVNRLLDEGRISREELEVRLDPEDLRILDQKVLPGMWYPIDSLGRLVQITAEEAHGRGGVDAVVDVGVEAAEKLFGSELYRTFVSTAEKWGRRAGPTLVRLAPLLCNFTRWSYETGSAGGYRFRVRVDEAGEFPEVLRFIAQGFIQYLAQRVDDHPVRVVSERPAPDRIVYTGSSPAAPAA